MNAPEEQLETVRQLQRLLGRVEAVEEGLVLQHASALKPLPSAVGSHRNQHAPPNTRVGFLPVLRWSMAEAWSSSITLSLVLLPPHQGQSQVSARPLPDQ